LTSHLSLVNYFFFYCSDDHPDLHSFPTRRSSDLRTIIKVFAYAHVAVEGHIFRHVAQVSPCLKRLCKNIEPGDGGATRSRRHETDRKSTRLNSSHVEISYAVFCLKKKKETKYHKH